MFKTLLLLTSLLGSNTTQVDSVQVELDPIIVTATKEPTRLSKIVNSVSVISHQKIQNANENNLLSILDDNFSSISLSDVNSSGYGLGIRGQGKISIRGLGFSPNRGVLVLTDGRPDLAGLFGHPLPDTYRKTGIYSAEIIKGSASTMYGSNAIAGVIEFTSFYRPDLDQFAKLELSRGSYNNWNGTAQYSKKIGKSILAGWYDYEETDNFRTDNQFLIRSGGIRIQFPKQNGYDYFVSSKFSSFDFSDPGPLYNLNTFTGDIFRTGLTFGINKSVEKYALALRIYNNYGEHLFSDGFSSVDRLNGVDLFGRLKDINQTGLSLSGGVSFNKLGGSANNTEHFSESELAFHLNSEIQLTNKLNLTTGGRYIHNEDSDGHFVYQAGSIYSLEQLGSLKLLAATSYRNPTINETSLFPISSDSLKVEEGSNFEIGYFNKFSNNVKIESAFFYREGKNLITTRLNPNSPPPVIFTNQDKYFHNGIEFDIKYFEKNYNLNLSYTHLNIDNFSTPVPEDKIAISLNSKINKIRINLNSIMALNPHSDSSGTDIVLDNYFVTNISGNYELTGNITIKTAIHNLFDTEYQIVHGYPMSGITFRFSITSVIL
ncbi:MAG: TonB-dependent receptor [candidate division Zixibacteria bacterium]|nr:TonB-dependent receptor [candidate division Zixibacteria bacterium]